MIILQFILTSLNSVPYQFPYFYILQPFSGSDLQKPGEYQNFPAPASAFSGIDRLCSTGYFFKATHLSASRHS